LLYISVSSFVFIINSFVYEKKETPLSLVFLLFFDDFYFRVKDLPEFFELRLHISPNKLVVVPLMFSANTTATRFKADELLLKNHSV
jgi:hypothetical protein